ncbi:FkbM family methyltransferase [Streptomyces sp. RTd22]|uniref:FkbM family methyltransferase n=1 Tax=Streptomyces sp. RTd22 TaxID=1841249 RepID=UPI001F0070DB|nr:FkbM family methyltransferase [Streptomyces sp. RTd22]
MDERTPRRYRCPSALRRGLRRTDVPAGGRHVSLRPPCGRTAGEVRGELRLRRGANAGQYGRRLRQLGYTGRIVSFEPTEEAFGKLEKAAKDDPEWWVFPFALGREEATQSMHVGWATMNSLLGASDYGKERYRRFAKDRTEEIEIRRLDSVMDKALAGLTDPRPYLKMDTQGYDLEVFAGAGDRIEEFVGLQSEVAVLRLYEGSPGMSEAVAAYEDSGFGITGMYPVTREDTTGRVVEFDCVMMRAAAAPK